MTYIKKAEITEFGKFRNYVTEFGKGLCELTFDNEFGKSTITDFILFVLYGFVSTRAKKIDLSEQFLRKYLPWDGGQAISGALTVVCDEKQLYIRRHQRESGRQTVSMTDENGNNIAFDSTPGEYIFGVDRDTFLRTFLIRQTDIKFHDTDGLHSALVNLVTTGDENTSFDKALDILYKNRTKYRHREKRAGRIFDIPREITLLQSENISLKRNADELESSACERAELTKKIDSLNSREKELNALLPKAQVQEAKNLVKNLDEIDIKIKEIKNRLEKSVNADSEILERAVTLFSARDRLENDILSAKKETARYRQNEQDLKSQKKKPKMPLLIGGILSVVAGLLFLPYGAVLSAAGSVLIILAFALKSRSELEAVSALVQNSEERLCKLEREYADTKEKCEYIIRIIGTDSVAGVNALHASLGSADSLRQILAEYESNRNNLLKGKEESELRSLALGEGCEYTVSDINAMLTDVAALRAKAVERNAELYKNTAHKSEIDKKIYDNGLKIRSLKAELESATYNNAVLEKAIEALCEANEQINSRFAPRLCELAGEILQKITDGRYQSVFLNNEFEIRVKADGGVRDLGYFSKGTADAVYFAMRFAASRLIANERRLPVIMDDPFWSLDNKRLALAKSYLQKISQDSQVILFSAR